MNNVLHEICTAKKTHIQRCKQAISESALRDEVQSQSATRGFTHALRTKASRQHIALITEIKKASPSKGLIRTDFVPTELAQAYEEGGSSCLSVLTDEPYFQGCNDYLKQARAACTLPVLRKDFMLDTYQVTEARAIGADCILLIMAALSDGQAQELEHAAHELHMDVLIETHDEYELERALMHLTSPLMGVNNRNLKTLEVDLATSERLVRYIPKTHLAICESGIKTHADIQRMQAHNIHCFLVGESLMLQPDVTEATRHLLG